MENLNDLDREFKTLLENVNHANYPRLREIYNILSKHSSDLFKSLNEYNRKLNDVSEITHNNLTTYGVYDATVSKIDQYGARLNIDNAKFQAKVDTHHLQAYEEYKRVEIKPGEKLKIIIVTHRFENNKRITNALFQKYPGHEMMFKFYDVHNKDLTLDTIQIGGFYKGFVNHVVPDKEDPTKGHIFVCLKSDITGCVKVNKIKDYEIGRIVDVRVNKMTGERPSTTAYREYTRMKEARIGLFELYI